LASELAVLLTQRRYFWRWQIPLTVSSIAGDSVQVDSGTDSLRVQRQTSRITQRGDLETRITQSKISRVTIRSQNV
jgi:hypothetical protein